MRKTARGICLIGLASMLLTPAASLAAADENHPSSGSEVAAGQPQSAAPPAPVWVKGPYGKLFPVGGWRNCAEAQAHGDTPLKIGDIGYNPSLDPTGSGIECNAL